MNKKKSIKIIDCTLRDGGYYNNWDFDIDLVNKYINSLELSNIKLIEIGFRFYQKNYRGPFAYTSDNFLKLSLIHI